MGFQARDIAKHGAEAFKCAGELYASEGTDAPATFVDLSPGTTMHVLTTGIMLSRFHKAHTCAAASQLPHRSTGVPVSELSCFPGCSRSAPVVLSRKQIASLPCW